MTFTATITSKRQLTIPSRLFKQANLSVGDKVLIQKSKDGIIIKKAINIVEDLAGSVDVPKHLIKSDIDSLITEAKRSHFEKLNQ